MSAIARERRRRRASRLHAILPHSNGKHWRAVLVVGMSTRERHDTRGLNPLTRTLATSGWQTAQRDEEDRRVLIAARELPVADGDDHPQGAAVAFTEILADLDGRVPDLTQGAHWLDDVILIPPGAIDSDDDLLWLDPDGTLVAAWADHVPGSVSRACADLAAFWRAQQAAGAPPATSLTDELF